MNLLYKTEVHGFTVSDICCHLSTVVNSFWILSPFILSCIVRQKNPWAFVKIFTHITVVNLRNFFSCLMWGWIDPTSTSIIQSKLWFYCEILIDGKLNWIFLSISFYNNLTTYFCTMYFNCLFSENKKPIIFGLLLI